MYNSESLHGSTPYQVDQSDDNGIFIHPLYGSVQPHDVHRLMGTTDCAHQLWGSVAPLTASVCFLIYTWQCSTTRWGLTQTGFSCTRYMDFYSSLTYVGVRLNKAMFTNYRVPLRPILQVYDSENAHGNTTPQRGHCHVISIVAHTLYGSVQLPDVHHLTGTTDCVHKFWRSVSSLTAAVRFRKCTWQCPTPRWALWRKQHFRAPLIRICTSPWRTSPYGYHRLCTPTMRTRGASYSECTIPKACMAVHHNKGISIKLTAFSYTRCMDLYSSLTYIALQIRQAVYTSYEDPWCLVQ